MSKKEFKITKFYECVKNKGIHDFYKVEVNETWYLNGKLVLKEYAHKDTLFENEKIQQQVIRNAKNQDNLKKEITIKEFKNKEGQWVFRNQCLLTLAQDIPMQAKVAVLNALDEEEELYKKEEK